jgi:hypothetical protein
MPNASRSLLAQQRDLRGHASEHRERAERIENNGPHDLSPSLSAVPDYSLNECSRHRLNAEAGQADKEPATKTRRTDAGAHALTEPHACERGEALSRQAGLRTLELSDAWATRRLPICMRELNALPRAEKGARAASGRNLTELLLSFDAFAKRSRGCTGESTDTQRAAFQRESDRRRITPQRHAWNFVNFATSSRSPRR